VKFRHQVYPVFRKRALGLEALLFQLSFNISKKTFDINNGETGDGSLLSMVFAQILSKKIGQAILKCPL
jgi:hypothetical protein